MSDNLLKKEFKTRDVQRMRNNINPEIFVGINNKGIKFIMNTPIPENKLFKTNGGVKITPFFISINDKRLPITDSPLL